MNRQMQNTTRAAAEVETEVEEIFNMPELPVLTEERQVMRSQNRLMELFQASSWRNENVIDRFI